MRSEACVLWLAAGLFGCGSASPTQPSATRAVLALAVSPDPLRAAPCAPSSCGPAVGELEAVGILTLSESAGVAADVTSLRVTLRNGAGAVIGDGRFDAAGVRAFAGGPARVPAGGTLVLRDVGAHFPEATPREGLSLTYVVEAIDERGNAIGVERRVPVS